MTHSHANTAQAPALPRPSRRLLALFERYLRWYISRHFHALRLAQAGRVSRLTGPTIVYLNHASWWDPLTAIVLSRRVLPEAVGYAPMEAAALERYGFMRKLGLFPVESGTARGAAQFLRAAKDVLATPGTLLWITPEGRFSDVRTRPVVFRPGLATLVSSLGSSLESCTLVPLAIEYTFWDERLPEVLTLFGTPIVADRTPQSATEWNQRLTGAMEAAQDELAALAAQREGSRFTTVLSGQAGVASIYDGWKRLRALGSRQPYNPEHGSLTRPLTRR